MMNDLEKYFTKNTGRLIQKWQHYFEIYERHFARFRGTDVCVLEFGVSQGGSLQMWREYFGPKARIFGVDINPHCKKLEQDGVEIFIGDQEDRAFLKSLAKAIPRIDILIDDGGHTMKQQITTFEELFAHIDVNGMYLCEDLLTAYSPSYGGGYKRRGSFIEYSKSFIDYINAWHSVQRSLSVNEFTRSAHSLHYYDSILVIEKRKMYKPFHLITGTRVIPDYQPPISWGQRLQLWLKHELDRRRSGRKVKAFVKLLLGRQRSGIPDYGYPCTSVIVGGHPGFVLQPLHPKVGHPWVWFAPVLQGEPNEHHAYLFHCLLAHGIAVAGIDIGESYGSPKGRDLFSDFHAEAVKMGLNDKPCLLAQSRGALMLFNWAAEHAQSVNCIAGIYPVMDMQTWPGLDDKQLQSAYQESAAQLLQNLPNNNPIARLEPLEKAGIPIFMVHGDADALVPLGSNSGLVSAKYKFAKLTIIHGGRHEDSREFFQNQALLDFLLNQNGVFR